MTKNRHRRSEFGNNPTPEDKNVLFGFVKTPSTPPSTSPPTEKKSRKKGAPAGSKKLRHILAGRIDGCTSADEPLEVQAPGASQSGWEEERGDSVVDVSSC
ncbi:hypothetical protein GWI33_016767 [Rhynchophorus ferrugineus]|uniref:Uncharacterized protein n=1 Tax=Rhynchophorus ferrugineus TaxID=354439 RepID=A0A834HZG7_RHYFE|nr:hypothetical protein GWI33_016767 [Rhynchophorus ferrugineus]